MSHITTDDQWRDKFSDWKAVPSRTFKRLFGKAFIDSDPRGFFTYKKQWFHRDQFIAYTPIMKWDGWCVRHGKIYYIKWSAKGYFKLGHRVFGHQQKRAKETKSMVTLEKSREDALAYLGRDD